jgi:GntR family transcriptional regulator
MRSDEGSQAVVLADSLHQMLGQLPPGSRAPSEHELAQRHGVNRLTARAVLQELEARHVVRRRQGAPTYVVRRYDYLVSASLPPSWTTAVREAGGEPVNATESIEVVPASEDVAHGLGLTVNDPVILLRRLRFVDGLLAGAADSWLPADLVPGLPEVLSANGSLHQVLEDVYGLDVARSRLRVDVDLAPPEVATRLQLRAPRDVIHLHSCCVSRRRDRPVEFMHSWLRADVFRLVIDMDRC